MIDLLLYCPNCFEQHVDKAEPDVCETCGQPVVEHWSGVGAKGIGCDDFKVWTNPPHKSHRCGFCNHVWRPADVPTNGVQKLQTKGERDGSAKPVAIMHGQDFNDAVETATKALAAENKRLREALEEIYPALGDYRSVEIAREALKGEHDGK